ncbi:putative carbohydrate ABC transporter-like,permease [Paracholeplasma brassicae]|uniref:Putative carbohydrate ABC transporter-like,permease n=1 Tax=Acholeplasma brassicae TaxID=61635 RepID=U4KMQ7_9MOLU|nr:sugar ABC transporter permease [Paracholeplasma brassicae]CCV65440.1 putative carbohydrate ABC transporter-like,permease [Paracholeplasma brassicae]
MKNKIISYVDPSKLEVHRIKTENAIERLQEKQTKNQQKIDDLMSENKNKNIKKIVKLADKNQKIKVQLTRMDERLVQINEGKLEKVGLYRQFKEWFSRIPYQNQKVIWGVLFTTPWLIGMILFFLPSFFKSIWWSFNNVMPSNDGLVISFVGLDNYIELFSRYVVDGNTVFNVELYMFVQNLAIDLPIILIFSILIAVFLNKPFKGQTIIKAIFFIPVIYNFTLISDTLSKGFGQYIDSSTGADQMFVEQLSMFFLEIGLGKSFMEIVLQAVDRIFMIVNLSGIQILIFIAAIQAIPNQLYEAAKMEGASKYVMFWKITIAMITPLILTAAIYTVVDSFTRAPIYRFLDFAMTQNRYGLAAGISVSYFIINIGIIAFVFMLMKGRVFYYDDRK